MNLYGMAHKFGDNVNTDYIISAKRKRDTLDMQELAQYVMEDLDPEFYGRISSGDFLVAGNNFGCGSSREVAPRVILAAGIKAVVAKSFARIFYRNAINTGLLLLECDTDKISEGDQLQIDMGAGSVHNLTTGKNLKVKPLPEIMLEILNHGGLVPFLQKKGGFVL